MVGILHLNSGAFSMALFRRRLSFMTSATGSLREMCKISTITDSYAIKLIVVFANILIMLLRVYLSFILKIILSIFLILATSIQILVL